MFSNHRAASLVVVLAVTTFAVTIIIGCGGHGPTLPSPPGNGGGGGGDVIEVDDFIVAAREVVEYDTDTTVQVTGIVRIDGAVIGADCSGLGQSGVSITIEAAGDVNIGGTVRAGAGCPASDALHSVTQPGDQTTGGDGGSLTIVSTGGDVTLAEGAQVAAGDGADGGNSLTGGPGGKGGDVTISAVEGTVTLPQTDDLIHQGNGGDGGKGDTQGDDIAGFPGMDEPTANGGDGGRLLVQAGQLQGLEIVGEGSERIVSLPAVGSPITGGGGGNGGDVTLGEDPPAGASVSAAGPAIDAAATISKQDPSKLDVHGGNGGDSHGYDPPGHGGHALSDPWWGTGESATARGGDGGSWLDMSQFVMSDGSLFSMPEGGMVAGNGGNAHAAWFSSGAARVSAACTGALDGGDAVARGGDGGVIDEGPLPDWVWEGGRFGGSRGGNGGDASAFGGFGQSAGDCCDPPGNGHPGGDGGNADAKGGDGGAQVLAAGGNGGDSAAFGSDGGDGADGLRIGFGGRGSGGAIEIAAGGTGSPPGQDGGASARGGTNGEPGEPCPGVITEDVYNAFTRLLQSPGSRYYVQNVHDLVSIPVKSAARPAQTTGPGGVRGPAMWVTRDGSRLFLAHSDNGIQVWDNPAGGVNATPDFLLTPNGLALAGARAQSVWLDEAGDNLYGLFLSTSTWTNRVCVWRNASLMTANRAADSSFTLPAGKRGSYLVGGANQNVLFISGNIISEVYVIDNPRGRSGEVVPDRTITATRPNTGGMAYDDSHNILYTFRQDTGGLRRHTIRVIANASAADGTPTFDEFYDTRLGDPFNAVVGLQVIGEQNLLFVGNQDGRLLAFNGASQLTGEVTADVSYEPDDPLQNFAIWHSMRP